MDVEFPLIKSELEAIDVQLLDAERTLFWNSEGTKAALIAPRAERGREGTGAGGGGVQPAWHLEFAVRLPGTRGHDVHCSSAARFARGSPRLLLLQAPESGRASRGLSCNRACLHQNCASILGVFDYIQEMREILHNLQNRIQKAKQNVEAISQAMMVSSRLQARSRWGPGGAPAKHPGQRGPLLFEALDQRGDDHVRQAAPKAENPQVTLQSSAPCDSLQLSQGVSSRNKGGEAGPSPPGTCSLRRV